jgi:hypothetical protein
VTAELIAPRYEPAFQIFDAFVNTTKHLGFAETRINVDPVAGQVPYKLEFGSFAYHDTTHPERDIEEVLLPGYAKASQAVVGCGNAVSTVLGATYPSQNMLQALERQTEIRPAGLRQ